MSTTSPAYLSTEGDLDRLEAQVVGVLRAGEADRPMAWAVIDGSSGLARLGRTFEALRFPDYDMAAAMAPYEDASLFLYTADLDAGRVAHVKRIVRAKSLADTARTGITGLEVIDDRLNAADDVEIASAQAIYAYHGITEPRTCWNLATNLITDRVRPTRARPYSLLSYKAVLELAMTMGVEHVFAYVNRMAIKSLGRLGVPTDLVMGREFHLPVAHGYDPDYVAVQISLDVRITRAFTVVDPAHPLSRVVVTTPVPIVIFAEDDEPAVGGRPAADEEVVIDLTESLGAPVLSIDADTDAVEPSS